MGNFSHLAAGAKVIVYGDENLGAGLVSPIIPYRYRDKMVGGQVAIGDFVSVLTNAVVAPGVRLREGCVLAANSFAKADIPPWEVWGGSPARFLKRREKGNMIDFARELGYE
jgi:acetyltransferase-like isoleucine patch superfamily enzyme